MLLINTVDRHEGPTLALRKVSRTDMGAYLCIASNGVPPTVSKRTELSVHCEYYNCNLSPFIIYLPSPAK